MKRRHLFLSLSIVPALVAALAGCSGSGSSSSSPSASASASATTSAITACPGSGSASKSISATGDFGGKKDPTLHFKKGVKASPPQVSRLIRGSGKKLHKGQYVSVAYAVYRASTAKELTSIGFNSGNPQVLSVGGTGFAEVLTCTSVGDRIVMVGNGQSLGFSVDYQIVVLADVLARTPTKSTGTPQAQSSSLPKVKDAANGEPTVTIPSTAAPSKTTAEVIKQGTGEKIASGDSVLVQYKGLVYSTGKVFDSTWKTGAPTTFTLESGSVITGFVSGLVGQRVGSQVLVVIAPKDGYGSSPPEGSGIPKNATLVFVVDLLAKG